MIITIGLVALFALIVLNVRASMLVMSEADTANKRIFQLLIVWLLPFVGAAFVAGIHRDSEPSRASRAPLDAGDDFGVSGQRVKVLMEALDSD